MKTFSFVSLLSALGLALLLPAASHAANPNPTWHVEARCLFKGKAPLDYDYYAVKDPTIVFSGGKYHVFYTGAAKSGAWVMLYSCAPTIEGLKDAPHIYLTSLGEGYFCAPQVFYYEPHKKWYLIYQNGKHGGAYATTTTLEDPASWSGPHSLGITQGKGYDFYAIADDTHVYLYNTPSDKSGNILVRKTTLANFPAGWDAPTVALTDTFEAVAVYKSLADQQFYLIVEDKKDKRYFELWTTPHLAGPWKQVAEKWASRHNLTYHADRWTNGVSHGEFIRAGVNQKLEIADIDRVDFLIQGTPGTPAANYQQIDYELGMIRNYQK
jgi:hypothetical protein